ncbi:MAG: hypothetical protein K1X89_14615 [Myxococcaceae bacterium]|nr:hypothetical protein [Myxococcaceae bacterium]
MNATRLLVVSVLGASLAVFSCGPGSSGGSGGGDGASGGGAASSGGNAASGGGSASSCSTRCLAKANSCGASTSMAQSTCTSVCGRSPTEAQMQCLEALDCVKVESPDSCFTGGSGGGSGSSGGGSASSGGGTSSSGGGASGGGTGTNPCAIPVENLKTTFPYVSLSPPTVVNVLGYPNPGCLHSTSGGPTYKGYTYASILNVIEASSPLTTDSTTAGYRTLQVRLKQRAPSSGEVSALSSTTGVPAAKLSQPETLRSTQDALVVTGYTVPAGATLSWFLPTSSGSEGWFQLFGDTSKVNLDTVLAGLRGNNVTITAKVGQFSGSDVHTYTFKLTSNSVQITQIVN